jgi:alcohol dehydrogenase class IV
MTFEFATASRVIFGAGKRHEAGALAAELGTRALVVTGSSPDRAAALLDALAERSIACEIVTVAGEPTLDTAAQATAHARAAGCRFVVAMGGGSALDAGKAIAALLGNGGEPLDYVEGVGRGQLLTRRSAPLLAMPTTAGTGSEVTRNAVLSVPDQRVKVSMRSRWMLPEVALVDPELTYSMPQVVTASTGLDALTHLIEAYVCNRPGPLTDALCREGIRLAARALGRAYHDGADAGARNDMSWASLYGGMALANARLGAVHGFAGPAGGMFPVPHGCACGRFLPYVMEVNVRALESRAPAAPVLPRFAEIAGLLTGDNTARPGDGVRWIQDLCQELAVPSLSAYGMREADIDELIDKAARASSMQGNPILLTRDELRLLASQAL